MEHSVAKKLSVFFTKFGSRVHKNGDTLLHPGQSPSGIYFLEKGMVRQYIVSKNGTEMTLNIYKQGSFFPMSWALNNTTNAYYFETMVDNVTLRIAPKENVLAFLHSNPDVLLDLLSRVFKGTEGVLSHMQALLEGTAYGKLVNVLVMTAKRFGHENNEGTKIDLRLTEKDLAALAGIQRETVSRLLQKLFKKSLLSKQGNLLVVTSIQKLEEELQNQ